MADNPNVYDRGDGVPTPGKNLFPGTMGENPAFTPDRGNGAVKTSNGGPATFNSGGADMGVLKSEGYHAPGELRAGAEQGPSFDDVSSNV